MQIGSGLETILLVVTGLGLGLMSWCGVHRSGESNGVTRETWLLFVWCED